MSILFNDNLNVSAPFPVDNRYGQTTDAGAASLLPFTPYASASAAHGAIPAAKKYVGLTVLVGIAPYITEWWYIDDPSVEANLVPKGLSVGYNIINKSSDTDKKYSFVVGQDNVNYQTYSIISGRSNSINNNTGGGTPQGSVILGVGNSIYGLGNSSYIIGEGNSVINAFSGAFGAYVTNQSGYSLGIGYDITMPSSVGISPNTQNIKGSLHTGIFNNSTAIDYNTSLNGTTFPILSIGSGDQAGANPAVKYNTFHVMKDGIVKSRDAVDIRYGLRGACLTQWHYNSANSYGYGQNGWNSDTGISTGTTPYYFEAGAKYIIVGYGFGIIKFASGTAGTNTISGTLMGPSVNPSESFANANVYVGATVEIISADTGALVAKTKVASIVSGGSTPGAVQFTITPSIPSSANLTNAILRIGDNFDNVMPNDTDIIWGTRNTSGCVFIASVAGAANLWKASKSAGGLGYGSNIVKVGRPSNPKVGEIGYNLYTNNLEYWDGAWKRITSTNV